MSVRSTIIMLAAFAVGVSSASALELKNVTFPTPGAGKVEFSHRAHLKKGAGGAPLSCKSCHSTGTPANSRYTMADMEKGKSCGKCHNGERAFALKKCDSCHRVKEITYQVRQTGPVHFSHKVHLQGMQCGACHNALFADGPNKPATMAQMAKGKSCGACHDGNKAFAIERCNGCHPAREVVFQVRETGPTLFSHQSHQKLYDCSACHPRLFAVGANKPVTMAAMEKGKACGACHNKKDAFAVSDCLKCHPAKEIRFKVADAGHVKFSHAAHLGMYRCNDCHTRIFPVKSGNKPVSMSEMEKGKSCGACHDGKGAFTVKENCESCHGKN